VLAQTFYKISNVIGRKTPNDNKNNLSARDIAKIVAKALGA
jgi:hypothetical protein